MRLISILLALCCSAVQHASAFMMAEPTQGRVALASGFHYRPIRDVALQIMLHYPPDQHHYVGIGRSPTPVIAMIQAILGNDSATNLPLRDLQDLQAPDTAILEGSKGERTPRVWAEESRALLYTSENLLHLHAHLKDRLPEINTAEGAKRMVFIDFADTGSSLINLKCEVDQHDQTLPENQRRPFVFLALAHHLNGVMQSLRSSGVTILELRGRALSLIDRILYKHLAEFDSWSAHNELTRKLRMRTRSSLRREYRANLKRHWWSGSKRETWARRVRRDMYRRYQNIEAYEDLRAAFAIRIARDPVVIAAVGHDARPALLIQLKIKCEALFDHVIDAAYQLRYSP